MANEVSRSLLVCFALVVFVGCDAIHGLPDVENPERVVEVAIFEGGYGIEWHQKIAEAFNRDHEAEGVRVELWGDPRTADIIKPRLLRRDPPDMILDERLPIWLLIGAGKLTPFTDALTKSPPGSDEEWGSLFSSGMTEMFKSDGEVYALPAAYGAWSCWYDARLFRERGWEVPRTWAEYIELCETIKEAGIAPLAFQGKYPSFYGWNTYIAIIQRVGGLAAINRINALEPEAFSHPDVVRASQLYQELAVDYFQRGAMAMTHTESQLQFVTGEAAMIFCGIWLENEMKENTPDDFEMRCFNLPPIDGGIGNPTLFNGQGMEYIFVPKDAQYPEEAFEFARYLISPKYAPDMGSSIGVISPLKNGTPRESVTPALASVLDMIEASDGIFNVRLRDLLLEWRGQVMHPAMAELLRGEITPEEFGRKLDDGIEMALANPDLEVPPHVPYDPQRFGEPQ